ncbi:type II toxin-antitoxin system RelE/ParE family toxin [Rhizobium sp. AQ_MP]|uniref:type II toxin-antitoxin system RelE/ParE family toxin n=1 Tax=Rhizobium sp. AQ_MP TaxID=2761536 RepID=UPI00163A56EF|nr:type II toxin-antitoxin system RelE/ParE family toxin [Rhizobium sp. AQ_MP]MBC2772079.1 type II toxin-antitoxin system RelE/ParE family toxin [Rhizobium sp. AQ_MP]
MVFEVELSEESEIDLKQIFDHLVQSYTQLGEPLEDAVDQASERVRRIRSDIFGLGKAPYQGTLSKEIGDGLRHVTKNRAIIYFDVYEATQTIQVIAVFFGGQDHQRHMLKRLS